MSHAGEPAYEKFRRLMSGEMVLVGEEWIRLKSPYLSLRDLREVLKSQMFKDFAALYPKDQSETPAPRAELPADAGAR